MAFRTSPKRNTSMDDSKSSTFLRSRSNSRSRPPPNKASAAKPKENAKVDKSARTVDLSSRKLTSFPFDLPPSLLAMDLSSNSLTSAATVFNMRSLLELNLSGNQLVGLDDLRSAVNLQYLDVSGNRLCSLHGAETLGALRYLDAQHNRISSLASLSVLSLNKHLAELSLRGNPCAAMPDYRVALFNALLSLVALDGKAVSKRLDGYAEKFTASATTHSSAAPLSGRRPRAHFSLLDPAYVADRASRRLAAAPKAEAADDVSGDASRRSLRSSLGGTKAAPSKKTAAAAAPAVLKSAARNARAWMCPSVNALLRGASVEAPLEISALSPSGRSVQRIVVPREHSPSPLDSPTRMSAARSEFVHAEAQRDTRRREAHALLERTRMPVSPRGRPSSSPPPSPTRASHLRTAHSGSVAEARGRAATEHLTAVARGFRRENRPQSESPPPSPTRATQARQRRVDVVLSDRARLASVHAEKERRAIGSVPVAVARQGPVELSASALPSFSPRVRGSGQSRGFWRDGSDEGEEAVSVRGAGAGDSVVAVLEQLRRSKRDTLQLLRASKTP